MQLFFFPQTEPVLKKIVVKFSYKLPFIELYLANDANRFDLGKVDRSFSLGVAISDFIIKAAA